MSAILPHTATLVLGPLPDAERLLGVLLARGADPLLKTSDLLATALKLRMTPMSLVILRKDETIERTVGLVKALRFNPTAASRKARILVLASSFLPEELTALRDAGVTMAGVWPTHEQYMERILGTLEADRRLWIESEGYCGPCRRTRNDSFDKFVARRAKDFLRR